MTPAALLGRIATLWIIAAVVVIALFEWLARQEPPTPPEQWWHDWMDDE